MVVFLFTVLAISILFLSAAIFVYAHLRDLRSETAGKILLLLFTSFLITCIVSIILTIFASRRVHILLGFAAIYSAALTFLALSILSIDIWLTFRFGVVLELD